MTEMFSVLVLKHFCIQYCSNNTNLSKCHPYLRHKKLVLQDYGCNWDKENVFGGKDPNTQRTEGVLLKNGLNVLTAKPKMLGSLNTVHLISLMLFTFWSKQMRQDLDYHASLYLFFGYLLETVWLLDWFRGKIEVQ